jgi:uncharacterized protein RhaS with RHS repeats
MRRYHYEDARFPVHLTGITDEAGQRIRSVAYDPQGRVAISEIPGTNQRTQFQYSASGGWIDSTVVTDDSAAAVGLPSTRTFQFNVVAGKLVTSSVSAPGPLCGNTAAQTSYDTNGNKIKEVAHDGTVTFTTLDASNRITEQASFPASYAASTTRPALRWATRIVSTA